MEAVILEAIAASSCVGIGIVMRNRSRMRKRSTLPPVPRSIGRLGYRHRREARAIVAIALEHLERHPGGSAQTFTAREALRSYLPETIAAYLAVPPAIRGSRRAGRPSANDELSRQLRTLRSGLERLREADGEAGAVRMAENGAFLSERFGPPERAPVPSYAQPTLREILDSFGAYLRKV